MPRRPGARSAISLRRSRTVSRPTTGRRMTGRSAHIVRSPRSSVHLGGTRNENRPYVRQTRWRGMCRHPPGRRAGHESGRHDGPHRWCAVQRLQCDPLGVSSVGNELAGETGEACNVIKKLERERLRLRGSRATVAQLAEELADVVIVVDLIASRLNIDLSYAIEQKFNATSAKVG